MDSLTSPWNRFYFLSMNETNNTQYIEQAAEENFAEQINTEPDEHASSSRTVSTGIINKGRRIDYVLQETPMEFVNQYLTAVTSHVCYWWALLLFLQYCLTATTTMFQGLSGHNFADGERNLQFDGNFVWWTGATAIDDNRKTCISRNTAESSTNPAREYTRIGCFLHRKNEMTFSIYLQ